MTARRCPIRDTKPGVRLLALTLLVPWLVAGGAASADEREFIVAAQPGAAMIHVAGRDAWGGGGGLDLSYGVTDAIAIRATGAFTGHALDPIRDKDGNVTMPGGTQLAWHAGL